MHLPNYDHTKYGSSFGATGSISEKDMDAVTNHPRKKICLNLDLATPFPIINPETLRGYIKNIKAFPGIVIVHTPETSNQLVMDVLSDTDRQILLNKSINIDIKVKDLPDVINILGERVTITCDYKGGAKPHIGENVAILSNSMINCMAIGPDLKTFGLRHTIIEDDVIIGYGVSVNPFNTTIKKGSIVESYNTIGTKGLVIGENAHIRSSYKIPGSDAVKSNLHFYNTGPENEIGRNAELKGNILFTGYNSVPPFSKITDNTPLVFSGANIEMLLAKIPYE